MYLLLRRLFNLGKTYTDKEKGLINAISNIVGSKPVNITLYKLSLKHTSIARETTGGVKESNERLEYLGDAVLGAVIAEYLFMKFPFKDEGFLTDIRSRIVNRESLNQLAKKIGLSQLVEYDTRRKTPLSHKSLYGDTLEAFVGAIYLDRGYQFCRRFIIQKLIVPHYDLEEIIATNPNFKSVIIEWSQKENRDVRFEIINITDKNQYKEFTAQLFVDGDPVSKGHGFSKKKAEQDAAKRACEALNI
ncbi:ribonuclease III [Roseivirga sp. BDSF3-8]|uniref:ribonuclease III n=1 Tax=Roseivirga sp. BDSF3-8 TaxID=3241598 RepID=UPI003531946B